MKLSSQINILPSSYYQERLIFTKHLATMISAGISITDALDTLIEQGKSPNFTKAVRLVLADIKNGKSLAVSLQKHPAIFDQFYTSLIAVSEESGTLAENLEFLAKQLAKDYTLRKKIRSALTYPAVVISVTIIMGGFISFYILPKLVDFFNSFDVELPLATKILIWFANLIKNYGLTIIAGIILIFAGLQFLVRKKAVRRVWHRLLLKMPIIGNLITFGQVARFSRNLGTLIKSGVPIVKSLHITAATLSNDKFSEDLIQLAVLLDKGDSIGESMKSEKFDEFPPIVSRMINVGEKTGKLDDTLLYLSDFYEEEVDDLSKNLSTILEPVLLVFIGLIVGFVALSIISPIYQLTGSIRK